MDNIKPYQDLSLHRLTVEMNTMLCSLPQKAQSKRGAGQAIPKDSYNLG